MFCLVAALIMMSVKHTHTLPALGTHIFWRFLSAPLTVRLPLFLFLCIRPTSVHQTLCFFSPLPRCLCSHRSWQTFWRSVTWCSQACSAWRCCWSCWLWASSATSKTPIMASTASLSSSGELLLPSALRLTTECSPRLADIVRLYYKKKKNALSVL